MVTISIYNKTTGDYIGDLRTDEDTNFGITVNNFNVSNPDVQKVSYSNSFKIPYCEENNNILGINRLNLIDNNKSLYTKYYVIVSNGGIAVGGKYDIIINSLSGGYYKITLINEKTIYDKLKEIKLDSLFSTTESIIGETLYNLYGYTTPIDGWRAVKIYGVNKNNRKGINQNSMVCDKTPVGISFREIFNKLETQENIKISITSGNGILDTHYVLLPNSYATYNGSDRVIIWGDRKDETQYNFIPEKITMLDVIKEICKIGFLMMDDISSDTQDELYLGDLYNTPTTIINITNEDYTIEDKEFSTSKQYINNYIKFGNLDEGQNELYGAYNIISNNNNLKDTGDILNLSKTYLSTQITLNSVFSSAFYTHPFDEEEKTVETSLQIFYSDNTQLTTENISVYETESDALPLFYDNIYKYLKPRVNYNFYSDIFNDTSVLTIELDINFFELFKSGNIIKQYNTIIELDGYRYFINKVSNITFNGLLPIKMELVRMDSI